MRYTLENGKTINIPDNEIQKHMKTFDISEQEAIDLYLEDEGYLDNEELDELDEKAKKVKIKHEASATTKDKKEKKPRTVKISDEKQQLFSEISTFLTEKYGNSVEIVKENKLLTVQIGEKTFKLDLIEQRKSNKKGVDMQKVNADYETHRLQMQIATLESQNR
jgi:hypothetical protein